MRSMSLQGDWRFKFFLNGTPHLLTANLSSKTKVSPLVNTYVQSGHSKWLLSVFVHSLPDQCLLHLQPMNMTDLPTYLPQAQEVSHLIKGVVRAVPLCWFPWEPMSQLDVNSPTTGNIPFPLLPRQRLLPCPACHGPHGGLSPQDPSQTCKRSHPMIHWCLSCWLWALSSILNLGKCRAYRCVTQQHILCFYHFCFAYLGSFAENIHLQVFRSLNLY